MTDPTLVRCVSREACLLLLRWTTFSCTIKSRFDLGFLLLSSEVEKWGARILHSFVRKEATETALVSALSEFWLLSVSRQRWVTRQGVSAMGRGALTDRARSSVRGSLNIGSRRGILL